MHREVPRAGDEQRVARAGVGPGRGAARRGELERAPGPLARHAGAGSALPAERCALGPGQPRWRAWGAGSIGVSWAGAGAGAVWKKERAVRPARWCVAGPSAGCRLNGQALLGRASGRGVLGWSGRGAWCVPGPGADRRGTRACGGLGEGLARTAAQSPARRQAAQKRARAARALGAARRMAERLRPYHPERARSRLISEAKQGRAWLVLGWETAWEYRVL